MIMVTSITRCLEHAWGVDLALNTRMSTAVCLLVQYLFCNHNNGSWAMSSVSSVSPEPCDCTCCSQTLDQARKARAERKRRQGDWTTPVPPSSGVGSAGLAQATVGQAGQAADADQEEGDQGLGVAHASAGAEPKVRGERRLLARHGDAEQVHQQLTSLP